MLWAWFSVVSSMTGKPLAFPSLQAQSSSQTCLQASAESWVQERCISPRSYVCLPLSSSAYAPHQSWGTEGNSASLQLSYVIVTYRFCLFFVSALPQTSWSSTSTRVVLPMCPRFPRGLCGGSQAGCNTPPRHDPPPNLCFVACLCRSRCTFLKKEVLISLCGCYFNLLPKI